MGGTEKGDRNGSSDDIGGAGEDPEERRLTGTTQEELRDELRSLVGSGSTGLDLAARRSRSTSWLAIGVLVAGLIVVSSLVVSATLLQFVSSDSPWVPVLQDVLSTGYQALALGALGGLAKLWLDRRAAQSAAADQLRLRQSELINQVIDVRHKVDNARFLITANRSVKTWSEQIVGSIVPARTEIRMILHEISNSAAAGVPVFRSGELIAKSLEEMSEFLRALIDEHAEHKRRLGELQRRAELSQHERDVLSEEVWDELRKLEHLGSFVDNDHSYGKFLATYLELVGEMRANLTSPNNL